MYPEMFIFLRKMSNLIALNSVAKKSGEDAEFAFRFDFEKIYEQNDILVQFRDLKQKKGGDDDEDSGDFDAEELTEEEKAVKKTTKDYCKSKLLPKVIENNKKCFFDKKIYQEFGSLGFLGITINGYGGANASNVAYGLVAKEFESIDSSYRSAISVQSSLVIHPRFYFGSDEQKECCCENEQR